MLTRKHWTSGIYIYLLIYLSVLCTPRWRKIHHTIN